MWVKEGWVAWVVKCSVQVQQTSEKGESHHFMLISIETRC